MGRKTAVALRFDARLAQIARSSAVFSRVLSTLSTRETIASCRPFDVVAAAAAWLMRIRRTRWPGAAPNTEVNVGHQIKFQWLLCRVLPTEAATRAADNNASRMLTGTPFSS